MDNDPELLAMSSCFAAVKDLDEDAQKRVLHWLTSKIKVYLNSDLQFEHNKNEVDSADNNENVNERVDSNPTNISSFETLAEAFAQAGPKSDWENTLLAACYLQIHNKVPDFAAFDVNKELKHLGYGVKNITDSLQISIDKKPQLILQLKKSGKAQQAKKKYKVSNEGVKYINSLLTSNK